MPLIETKGAASAQGFGEFAKTGEAVYIESCFSTWLYTGNGSTQTITNGIDLSTKGGLVWIKDRTSALAHQLFDTARGATKALASNSSGTEDVQSTSLTSFNTTGFSLDSYFRTNGSGDNFASWTFRKQPKFFDVVTYTGDGGTGTRSIAHSLGSTPGCVIVKATSASGTWYVQHRSIPATQFLVLQLTEGVNTGTVFDDQYANSTNFFVRKSGGLNLSGTTYVAYLFAHDAGGFGLTGTDNVISCGAVNVNGSGLAEVNLGWEPQWVMVKGYEADSPWAIFDNMRGMPAPSSTSLVFDVNRLSANSSEAESVGNGDYVARPTATGFQWRAEGYSDPLYNGFIYIAIRRGPMKTPTTGTSVFQPTTWTGTGAALQQNVNINYDSFMQWRRNGGYSTPWMDKLRGFGYSLYTQQTTAEVNQTAYIAGPKQNNFVNFVNGTYNLSGEPWLNYAFVRAPGFFDVVCYTGNATSNTSISHNLTVIPELWIVKARNEGTRNWQVYYDFGASTYSRLVLNTTGAATTGLSYASSTNLYAKPTASALILDSAFPNTSAETYVAYLFATVSGVSKVGSYTGTGTTKQIDCGFTGGARFVLIKRTDSTGDWYCWDSSRGIVSGNDSYLVLNSTAAEVTNTDWVDTYSAGFELSNAAGNNVNINGASYIFLSVA